VELTPDDAGDVSALPDLLDQIEAPAGSVTAPMTATRVMTRCCTDTRRRASSSRPSRQPF
jgi:hypothetical protein